jgi:hypothetical protein
MVYVLNVLLQNLELLYLRFQLSNLRPWDLLLQDLLFVLKLLRFFPSAEVLYFKVFEVLRIITDLSVELR